MMVFPGCLDYPWGEVASVHCVGSYWAPGFSNYLLLFQVIIRLCEGPFLKYVIISYTYIHMLDRMLEAPRN